MQLEPNRAAIGGARTIALSQGWKQFMMRALFGTMQ
jgi:hypothetical protein